MHTLAVLDGFWTVQKGPLAIGVGTPNVEG